MEELPDAFVSILQIYSHKRLSTDQIVGSVDDPELYAIVIKLLNQSKEIGSLDMVPTRRTRRAREGGV